MKKGSSQDVATVLKYQHDQLEGIENKLSGTKDNLNTSISSSEELLMELGVDLNVQDGVACDQGESSIEASNNISLPDWDTLLAEARSYLNGEKVDIKELFTEEELFNNHDYIEELNDQFNLIYKLDNIDWTICAVAAIVSAAMDILLVGIPSRSKSGLKAGSLSNYIREYFEKRYPPEEMEKLGGKAKVKTPYDAQDNRNTKIEINGLSAYYHRLLELGHDPLLGFVIGVLDIMRGTMTTIDKKGKIVVQVIDEYSGRTETTLWGALTRQLLHLKSDLTTSMGLPAPLMGLFNLFQFGSIGKEEQTIAEIVQGMYYEGYDFIHFCSMSIPVMLTEIIVRISWAVKRLSEGYSMKESLPLTHGSKSRINKPKLETMLFIAHSGATAINVGKLVFTKNPMAINYPQWLAWSKYAFSELKWELINKPDSQNKYVLSIIESERVDILRQINEYYDEFVKDRKIINVL